MRIHRLPAAFFGIAASLAASPAAAQFALGPVNDQGQGPTPALLDQLRQNTPSAFLPYDAQNTPNAPQANPPMWQIAPRLDLREELTDNVRNSSTNRTEDLITTVAPGVFVSADGPRFAADLDYSPEIAKFANASDQDHIDHRLFTDLNASVVSDLLNLEARGSIFQSAAGGSLGALSPSTLNAANRTNSYAYEASPVLRTRLDSLGDEELRYILGQTWFTDNTGPNGTSNLLPISHATHQEVRSITDTGDIGKYLSNRLTLDGQRTDVEGTIGSNKEAYGSDEILIHVRPNFALLGAAGYQIMTFANDSAQNLSEPTWYAGFQWQPNQDSMVELNYGHRDGADSFLGDMRYSLTPATTAYASYAETVTTPQEAILSNLGGAIIGPNGTIISSTTGLPISLNNNELSLQNDVERLKTFQAALVTNLDPNRYGLTVIHQDQTSLTNLVPNDSMNGAFVTWDRQLNQADAVSLLTGYFWRDFAHSNTFNASAELRHQFTDSLFGAISYSFADNYAAGGGGFYRNSLIFTLRKVF